MGIVTGFELYVDGVKKFESSYSGFNIEILSDQFLDAGGVSTGHYSYDEGEYAGWTTTQGGTTPDYEVGDTFFVNGQMYLYSIPAATPKETFEANISALNDVLNEKAGTTGQHTIAQMVDVAESITVGTDTSDANATAGDILLNKTAYVNGVKLTGTIATYDGTVV